MSSSLNLTQREETSVREVKPPFIYKNGAIYDGEWVGDMKDGYGILRWPENGKYEGDWKYDKAHG